MAIHAPITGAPLRAPLAPKFELANRADIESEIERLISLLDQADAPTEDLEGEDDYCPAGDDGCGMTRSIAGGLAWGSRDEAESPLLPTYEVDQAAGPLNVREAWRAHYADHMRA